MGQLETEVRIKTRNSKIHKAVLYSLGAVGVLSVAVLAPNALQMLKLFGFGPGKKNQKYAVMKAASRLALAGLVVFEKTPKGKFVRLTGKGRERLALLEAHNFQLKKPKRWDKKWRMVIFDIKERRKNTRNTLRDTLRAVGFTKLQNSVWVYPYDCEDLIVLLKAEHAIGKDVLYVIADKIENDLALKGVYGLK